MTAEFIPSEGQEESSPYPEVFGIKFTPVIIGGAIVVAGLAGAIFMFLNLVLPAQDNLAEKQKELKEKDETVQSDQEIQEEIQGLEVQLNEQERRKAEVLQLFSDEQTQDTLLLDLNTFAKSPQSELVNFKPEEGGVVDDGSLGTEANGKLERQSFTVAMEGTFEQTQSVIRNIEKLTSLLVVKEFTSELTEPPVLQYNQDQNALISQGTPTLRTTFRLDALIPIEEVPSLEEEANEEEEEEQEE